MTEHTPEKVAALIVEARKLPEKFQAVQLSETQYLEDDALAELDAVGYLAVYTSKKLADALEATVREMHARELHHFESEQAMSEALAVIEEIRAMLPGPRTFAESLARDFAGNLWPRTIDADEVARTLSRIPEHPKED